MGVDLREIGRGFGIGGEFVDGARFGAGRIHESYVATWAGASGPVRYLHQRLNRRVFPDLDAVMGNIVRILEHRSGPARAPAPAPAAAAAGRGPLPDLVRAADGAPLLFDPAGDAWRTWRFIPRARTHARIQSLSHAREAGRAYGGFLRDLADLLPPRLMETIPGFHDTPARLAALPPGAPEAARIARLAAGADAVVAGLAAGDLPERPVHNDTKLDNVLVDDETGRAVAVVDLDTVMPGSAVTDFGDLVRSAVNPGTEEAAGPAEPRLDVFRAVAEGWIGAARDVLTPAELELLPMAGRLIALELGVRFLADHLAGDRYFRVSRPGENLRRARIQLSLAEGLMRREPEMRRILAEIDPRVRAAR